MPPNNRRRINNPNFIPYNNVSLNNIIHSQREEFNYYRREETTTSYSYNNNSNFNNSSNQTRNETRNQTRNQILNQTRNQIRNQTRNQTRNHIRNQTRNETRNHNRMPNFKFTIIIENDTVKIKHNCNENNKFIKLHKNTYNEYFIITKIFELKNIKNHVIRGHISNFNNFWNKVVSLFKRLNRNCNINNGLCNPSHRIHDFKDELNNIINYHLVNN